jgi:hypothetical protein
VPFLMLLSRNRKRDPRRLMKVARIVVLARVLDYFWLVIPAFPDTNAFHAAWMSIAALIALGGVWVPWFVRLVAAGPQLPEPDPRPGELQEATAS